MWPVYCVFLDLTGLLPLERLGLQLLCVKLRSDPEGKRWLQRCGAALKCVLWAVVRGARPSDTVWRDLELNEYLWVFLHLRYFSSEGNISLFILRHSSHSRSWFGEKDVK